MKNFRLHATKNDRLEHALSPETMAVLSSPVVLVRRKKTTTPIYTGVVKFQMFPADMYTEMMEIEEKVRLLYKEHAGDPDYYYMSTSYESAIRNQIDKTDAYWWQFYIHRGFKEDSFTFLHHSTVERPNIYSISNDFREKHSHKQWGALQRDKTISLLKKYRIFSKIINEMVLYRLSK